MYDLHSSPLLRLMCSWLLERSWYTWWCPKL